MSPQTRGEKGTANDPYQWVHIEDFTPGIWTKSFVDELAIVPAPLGASQAPGTWGCGALPGGGLGPLPGLVFKSTYTETFRGATDVFVVGMAVNPALVSGHTELVIMVEATSGSHHYFLPYSYVPTVAINNIATAQITANPTPGFFGAPYPTWTRMRATDPTTKPGYPTLVFPASVTTDPHGTSGHLFAYPDPTTRTAFKAKDLITVSATGHGITGQVIGYSNAVVVLTGVKYTWPAGTGITINENIDFTTPPNSDTYGNQQTVFVAENPWGYGAWGSISTGELLLVKKEGGGVIISGTIASPVSAIYLPGIQPTGDFVGHADASELGLFYCSQNMGAWVWNGGNTSQKISTQLLDNFYDCSTGKIASNNYGFFACRWGQYIVFSNNYIYDTATQSWWLLYPQTNGVGAGTNYRRFFHYSVGRNGYELWACPLVLSATGVTPGPGWVYRFDSRLAAKRYRWQSLPIHVAADANQVVDVRQVVVRASGTGTGSSGGFTVQIGTWIGTSDAVTLGKTPKDVRFNVGTGASGQQDIVVTIAAHNETPTLATAAPTIHSIDIGYQLRAHIEAANS